MSDKQLFGFTIVVRLQQAGAVAEAKHTTSCYGYPSVNRPFSEVVPVSECESACRWMYDDPYVPRLAVESVTRCNSS